MAPQRELHGLNWLFFFVADLQAGFGPFVAVYLTTHSWTQAELGLALGAGSASAMLAQVPAGMLVDALRSKAVAGAAALIGVGASAMLMAWSPALWPVLLAQSIQGLAHLIHRIAGIRWRVSHKRLILFTDWVSRPLRSPDHSEPHPPCTTIRLQPFWFPAVGRKKVTAAFDGGRLTSDGGVMLLAAAERRIGHRTTLAALIADPRDPLLVTHSVGDILRARMLAIACGYEDADDLDHLRSDPGFKLACGRLPDSGDDLCSQPTMSRWENAPTLREVVRMTYAMIDIYCASYRQSARRRHAGHRRHRRCRARPSAARVVQCALR